MAFIVLHLLYKQNTLFARCKRNAKQQKHERHYVYNEFKLKFAYTTNVKQWNPWFLFLDFLFCLISRPLPLLEKQKTLSLSQAGFEEIMDFIILHLVL